MSYGKGRGGLDRQIICLKYLIFFSNVLCWLLGAAIFALATWIRYQDDFKEWVIELGFQHYWTGTWILFAGGVSMMIITFIGCCATLSENPHLLTMYIGLLSASFIVNLAGAAYTLDHGIEYSKLTPWLRERFLQLIGRYNYDTRARRIMNTIQEFIGCCGSINSGDYDNLGMEIPYECRNHVTGNDYSDGCMEVFAWYMETKTGWLAGAGLFMCFFQAFAIAFGVCLCKALRREKGQGQYRDSY